MQVSSSSNYTKILVNQFHSFLHQNRTIRNNISITKLQTNPNCKNRLLIQNPINPSIKSTHANKYLVLLAKLIPLHFSLLTFHIIQFNNQFSSSISPFPQSNQATPIFINNCIITFFIPTKTIHHMNKTTKIYTKKKNLFQA